MNTILVILPYFGKFPNMFPFWLESCRQNSTVDFLIATDQDLKSLSSNIYVLQTSLQEIKQRIEKYIGFNVCLEKPYKLCDFRPIYSNIFVEYTSQYDFWGYCDCDLIFGDIRHFLTDELLNGYDYLLGMGHFHIQRVNDPKFEEVWKTARGLWREIYWKDVFKSTKNEWFDELPHGVAGRYYEMYPHKFWSGYAPQGRCYESPSPKYPYFFDVFNHREDCYKCPDYTKHQDRLSFWHRKPSEEELHHVIYLKNNITLHAVGVTKQGKLLQRPILYAHFYKRKLSIKTSNVSAYIIRPNTFINERKITKLYLLYYSHHPSIYYHKYLQKIKNRLNRYFHLDLK